MTDMIRKRLRWVAVASILMAAVSRGADRVWGAGLTRGLAACTVALAVVVLIMLWTD